MSQTPPPPSPPNSPPPAPKKSEKPLGYRGYSPEPPSPSPVVDSHQLSLGGNKDEKVQYKGGSYKVRTGPKGGKYILVKQEKVYLKK